MPQHALHYWNLLRPQQWSKNLLIFAPVFFSGTLSRESLGVAALAFLAFCLAASATYIINDILDAPYDRVHPHKCHRPIASGTISPISGLLLSLALLGGGFYLASGAGSGLLLVMTIYCCASVAYSIALKHIAIVDILWLSVLFSLRIIAGVAATNTAPSTWIILFTWLLALMLVSGKRYVELSSSSRQSRETRPVLGHYPRVFLRQLVFTIGGMSLMCYLLWSAEAAAQGRFLAAELVPSALFVAFGVFRYQLLVVGGQFREDPTAGILRDIPILIAIACFVLYLAFLLYF